MAADRKRILVTGATGFLGCNLLKAFSMREDAEPVAACRDADRLPESFQGEVRTGDLRDADYRKSVVEGIDVICHTGTWAAMWDHARQEEANFYRPTLDLIEQAIAAGVERFLMTSTVAIARPRRDGTVGDDFAEPVYTGFWPHLDRLVDVDNYMRDNARRGMQMVDMRLGHSSVSGTPSASFHPWSRASERILSPGSGAGAVACRWLPTATWPRALWRLLSRTD